MSHILSAFYIFSFIFACIAGIYLYKQLPNKNEKLKLIIPILIALGISMLCYLAGLKTPSISFGRFM